RPHVDGAAPEIVRQLPSSDSVEPGRTRPSDVAESSTPLKGNRKGLGKEIRRHVVIANPDVEIDQERFSPTVVDRFERSGIAPRGEQELRIFVQASSLLEAVVGRTIYAVRLNGVTGRIGLLPSALARRMSR